jgi:cell division septation protein DedD
VIIRNVKNEKFVIGSLFHRDDVKDAPLFQISADAAQALGVLTGQPIKLEVTALRSQNASSNDVRQGQNPQSGVAATALVASEKIETTTSTKGLTKSFIQLGIFNVEQNAKNTATLVRQVGIVPLIKQQSKDGKPFWRVLIGPANSLQERAILLKTVKSVGFKDAYAVTH